MSRVKFDDLDKASLKYKIITSYGDKEKKPLSRFADEIKVTKADLSNYFKGNTKVGTKIKKKIKLALIERGFIPKPKVSQYMKCPTCNHKTLLIKKGT